MPTLLVAILLVMGLSFSGCVDTRSHMRPSPNTQSQRYIETEGLSQLPNRRLAITSFGIEYDTKLLFPLRNGRGYQRSGGIYTVSDLHKEIALDLTREHMQVLADQVYTQLVEDLQAAGYDIVPYNMYHDLPAYRSLIELAGSESPVSVTFKLGDPENLVLGEALVFAPTGLRWYSPALEEVGSRLGETLASLGSDIRLTRRSLLGGQALSQAEADLANAMNATLLKAYYVVSPVRSFVETKFLEGVLPVEGNTIVGRGETRLAFRTPDAPTTDRPLKDHTPPRDGNAFVRLTRDVQINTAGQDLGTYLDTIGKLFILALMAER